VAERIPIGRFARLSGLTVKALRHYDAMGLLRPDAVDPLTRHRSYGEAQLDRARRIRRLRALDVPLEEIRAMLDAPDGGRTRLRAYRRDVEARLARDQRILHGLSHLLEGDDMTGTRDDAATLPADEERRLAAELFNLVWELLETEGRTEDDDDRMLHAAHASRHHWGQVGDAGRRAIGEWQCSRVYAVLGRAEPALHHARRCLAIAAVEEVEDWLVAAGHEALTRAYAVAGEGAAAAATMARARAAVAGIADEQEREVIAGDLDTIVIPGA
jgi:DNA-binding transcriptional MerR regulator